MGPASLQTTTARLQPTYTKGIIESALRSPLEAERVWVLVEDTDDMNVYKRFFDTDIVNVLPAEDEEGRKGFEHVETIVTDILRQGLTTRIFGIRDTDYTRYEDTVHQFPPAIFHTDFRDVEMMLFSAPSVTTALVNWNPEFPAKLIECLPIARYMGYLRICNHIYKLGCRFKRKVKISVCWQDCEHAPAPDREEILVRKFLEHCHTQFTREQFEQTVRDKGLVSEDYLHVCQGHDLLDLLQRSMFKLDFNKNNIMTCMTNAYSSDDFRMTQLYYNISAWAVTHGVCIFVA